MSKRDLILSDMKQAMKLQDKFKVGTLRLIIAAIKQKDIELRSKVSGAVAQDKDVFDVLKAMIKQRQQSIEAYQEAGREELVLKEQNEINTISAYLPQQPSPEQQLKTVEAAIRSVGATSSKDMGAVMAYLKTNHPDDLDFSMAAKIVKNALSS